MKESKLVIWLVYLESNVDGNIIFEAVPCENQAKAREVLKEQKELILKESRHFSGYTPEEFNEYFEVEESEDTFFITDPCDDYWEDYRVVEKEVLF